MLSHKSLFAILAGITVLEVAGNDAALGADAPFPSFATVKAVVQREFAHKPDYQPGDLISSADVETIFDELNRLGWPPDDVESVADSFLPEGSLLVQELRTEAGRRFMRQVASLPGVYDRLERISWIANGRQWIEQLMENPGGVESMKILTRAEGVARFQSLSPTILAA